jgi:eukaryotic-like serine/threonine-protein kinase
MPRDLETICLKALQKDPARRYPDVTAMAEDLRRFRAGEPIVARPISGPDRVWRWCRRNPKVATLAAAIALLVVFGLIGATAAAVVIAGKNRALSRANFDLVAAKETSDKRRVEAESAQKRAEEDKKLAIAAGRAAIQQNRNVVEAQREMILLLENKWRNVPALGAVRQDVLGPATRILESAAGAMTTLRSDIGWPEADEELNWRRVGLAHQRIGEVRLSENKLAEAEKEFRLNHEFARRLAAARSSRGRRRRSLDRADDRALWSICGKTNGALTSCGARLRRTPRTSARVAQSLARMNRGPKKRDSRHTLAALGLTCGVCIIGTLKWFVLTTDPVTL